MAEEFGMRVFIDYVIKNLPDIKKQTQTELKNVDANIGNSIKQNVDKAGSSLDTSFKKILSSFSSEFGDITSRVANVGTEFSKVSSAGMGKTASKGAGGAVAGGMGLGLGAVAGIGAGLVAGVSILKTINKGIDRMYDKLAEASIEFRSSRELMDNMWNLALRPMGNMMSLLMRPYLMLSMQYLRPRLQEAQAVLRESGGKLDESDIAKMTDIFEGTSEGLGFIFQDMFETIKPIAGQMMGFQKGTDILYNNFLDGMEETISGITKAFTKIATGEFTMMPKELAESILEYALSDISYLERLPENLAEDFLKYTLSHPDDMIGFPSIVTDELMKWIEIHSQELESLPIAFINYAKEWGIALESPQGELTIFGQAISDSATSLADITNKWRKTAQTIDNTNFYISEASGVFISQLESMATDIVNARNKIDSGTAPALSGVIASSYYGDQYKITGTVKDKSGLGYSTAFPEEYADTYKDDYGGYSSAFPMYANGVNFVPETGPAILHRGETVINPMKTNSSNNNTTQLIQKVNFFGDIKSDVDVESLSRNIKRQTEFALRRKSL